MQKSFLLLFLLFAVGISYKVYNIPNATNPAFPGHCYFDATNEWKNGTSILIKVGERKELDIVCGYLRCDAEYKLMGHVCNATITLQNDPNCEIVQDPDDYLFDLNEEFPGCCPTIKCS